MAMLISLGRVSAQPPDPHDSGVNTHLPLDPRVYNNYKAWRSLLTFSSHLISVCTDGWLSTWVTCNYYVCDSFISLHFYVRWSNTGANLRFKNGENICYWTICLLCWANFLRSLGMKRAKCTISVIRYMKNFFTVFILSVSTGLDIFDFFYFNRHCSWIHRIQQIVQKQWFTN